MTTPPPDTEARNGVVWQDDTPPPRTGELRSLVVSDLHRYAGKHGLKDFAVHYWQTPGFQFSVYLRLCVHCKRHPLWRWTLYWPCLWLLKRRMVRFGIQIQPSTAIGPGLYLPHWGGIVINSRVVIGRNCNLSHNVTIGKADRGKRQGTPIIGDNVYIGPGAVLFGAIRIGNNAAIGANAVVLEDVPENGVVVGTAARLTSLNGSTGYVKRTDYEDG